MDTGDAGRPTAQRRFTRAPLRHDQRCMYATTSKVGLKGARVVLGMMATLLTATSACSVETKAPAVRTCTSFYAASTTPALINPKLAASTLRSASQTCADAVCAWPARLEQMDCRSPVERSPPWARPPAARTRAAFGSSLFFGQQFGLLRIGRPAVPPTATHFRAADAEPRRRRSPWQWQPQLHVDQLRAPVLGGTTW